MDASLTKYLKAFKKLRIDRAHGVAPHKPVLLLSVIQLIKENHILHNKIYLTPELIAKFKSNWSKLVHTQHDARIALPFYHLQSDGFWHIVSNTGYENLIHLKSSMRSIGNLSLAIDYVYLDSELYHLLIHLETNEILQDFIVSEYFPSTKEYFYRDDDSNEMVEDIRKKILNEDAGTYSAEIKALLAQHDEDAVFMRGSVFKREVPRIYHNTCCISGLRIDTTLDISMIDACHIIPFSKSYDDTVQNGIALCPNLHRAFDRGLIGIDSKFCVIISPHFVENGHYGLKQFEAKTILLPENIDFQCLQTNFEWHRKNLFKA